MMPNITLIKNRFAGWDVLIVEDEPDSMEVACRWLKLTGATVHRAENGQQGLELTQNVRPRFILSDLTMPVMDGWEMLYELKQDPSTANIPVIALTAHALKSVQEQALRAGFTAHISKPLNPNKFVEQVIDILKDVPEFYAELAQ
jgi:CheY-like chemotaxis protein